METFKNEQVNSTKIHQKQSNIPQIRFKGFNDAWEQRRLGEAFINLQNNTLSRAELSSGEGKVKNVHYGDLLVIFSEVLNVKKEELPTIKDESIISKYKESFLKNGDIVMADTAEDETVGKCTEIEGLTEEIVISGLHTIPYRPQSKFAPRYLGYYLNSAYYHDQLLPLTQGIKVSSISKTSLKSTYISYPKSLVEQGKIGNFFNYLDHLITLHQRKCDQLKNIKKSLLEKLFPKNGTLYPELRFKEFTDAWEQCKLDEITNRVLRKNKNLESELPLTISAQEGLVDQEKFFNKRIASKDLRNYLLVENGEFAYNKSYSSGYPWGVIKRLDKYPRGVVSSLYIVFSPILDKIDSSFLVVFFESELWHSQISKRAAEGARNHGLLNIQASDFFDIDLTLSSLSEQHQIGQFFKDLDNLITLHQRKVEKLKKVKASLLEKMFV